MWLIQTQGQRRRCLLIRLLGKFLPISIYLTLEGRLIAQRGGPRKQCTERQAQGADESLQVAADFLLFLCTESVHFKHGFLPLAMLFPVG